MLKKELEKLRAVSAVQRNELEELQAGFVADKKELEDEYQK